MPETKYLPGDTHTRIRDLLAERGMTISQLADAIGCDETTLGRYLRGDTKKIGDELLIKIAGTFDVSLDFLMGQTDVPDKLSFALSDLGLSVKAAQNLYTQKVDPRVVNLLLENERFAKLSTQLSRYFDNTFVSAFAAQNQMYGMLASMILGMDRSDAGQSVAQDVSLLRAPAAQAELEEIEKSFSLTVRDIKKNIEAAAEGKRSDDAALTKDIMTKMRSTLLKGKGKAQARSITPQALADAITEVSAGELPAEEKQKVRDHMLAVVTEIMKNHEADPQ